MIAVPYQGALNTLVVVMILRLIVKEKFQIYLCFSITVLTLGDDGITLKRGLGIEHAVVHLLWGAVFEGICILNILHRGV